MTVTEGRARDSTVRATLLVLLAASGFGSISTLVLIARRGGAPLVTVLAARYLIAAVLLLVAAGGPRASPLPRPHALRALLIGGGGQAVVTGVSLAALAYVSAGTLGFLFYTYPAWITAIAAVRGHERLTVPRAIALALSLGGVAMMVGAPGTESLHPLGLALALGSALAYALYVPFVNELQRGTTAAVTSVHICLGAGVIFTVIAFLGGPGAPLGLTGWAAIGVLALFCTAVAFLAFLRGLARLGPVRTSILSTVEPFWTALLGAAVLRQRPSAGMWVGGAMIAAAVVLLQLKGDGRPARVEG